jgi:hypothetical protein
VLGQLAAFIFIILNIISVPDLFDPPWTPPVPWPQHGAGGFIFNTMHFD